MRKSKNNIFKSLITTSLGVACGVITLILLFASKIDFVWEGIGGLVIATLLILAPDAIVTNTGVFIGKFTKKGEPDNQNPPV